MKAIYISIFFVFISVLVNAQGKIADELGSDDLPIVYLNKKISTHFVSGLPIKYADLSTNMVIGDQPFENLLRVKPIDSLFIDRNLGVLTIVTERHIVQYDLVYTTDPQKANTDVTINDEHITSFIYPNLSLSLEDMHDFSVDIIKRKPAYHDVATNKDKMVISLNNLYTMEDYFFVDVTMENRTNIKYDINDIRFKIEDKHNFKATSFQAKEIDPVFQLNDKPSFKKRYRNVFVFKKFTFPDEKVFTIEFNEEQISGRRIVLKIEYSDVLNADLL